MFLGRKRKAATPRTVRDAGVLQARIMKTLQNF
jgi:hypothetical protein